MDLALQARNMGSATARRLRIQERQVQRHLASQERMDRKKHILSEFRSADDSDSDSESSSSNPDLDSSAETPSESSVQTPEESSSPETFDVLKSTRFESDADVLQIKSENKHRDTLTLPTQSRPKMQATLTTIADWNYDRFSMFVDPTDVEEMLANAENESTLASSDEESEEEHSPIEIATPIRYTLPKTKPLVISIAVVQQGFKSLNKVQHRPEIRRHVSDQFTSHSAGPGNEGARLYQNGNTSNETLSSANNSSQVSRSVSLASHNESMVSRSVSQTSQSDQSHRSPKRKPSLPLLFSGNKTGHSRMSSIKKLIRQSTLGPPPSPTFGSLQRQASNATLATHMESREPSLEIPRSPINLEFKYSTTTNVSSPLLQSNETLTATPPALPSPTEAPLLTLSPTVYQPPTKPVSRFRQRSGSIGQALRSIHAGPKKADPSAPPVPMISIPPVTQAIDTTSTLTPPPLTPRNPRRSTATYSIFPTGDNGSDEASIGLGLRY